MPSIKIAHIREQGVDLVIVPLESSFGHKTRADQDEILSELQTRSYAASLRGTVVPVWDSGGGRMSFRAPNSWHPYFRSISLRYVWTNVNRELSW